MPALLVPATMPRPDERRHPQSLDALVGIQA